MTFAFLCSPFVSDTRTNLRNVPKIHVDRNRCPSVRMPDVRMPVSCRMRNRGGFRLPPRVPQDVVERGRAVELLGNLTQRKNMKQSTKKEIEALVGALPQNRLVAQQWKVALQHTPNARRIHLANPNAFKHRKEAFKRIQLPQQNDVLGRCFVLLGCLERRYRHSQPVSQRVVEELKQRLGDYPVDVREAHHFRKALTELQKERRSRERRPARVPTESMEELLYAKMLLGYFSVRGHVGRQDDRLQQLIGAVPRNRNVANSWKKIIAAAIRKKKRQDQIAVRLDEMERKRKDRRERRESKLRQQVVDLESRIGFELATRRRSHGNGVGGDDGTSQDALQPSPTAHIDREAQHDQSFVSRLQSMLGAFFGRKR